MLPLRTIAMAVVLVGAACADEPTRPDPLPPPPEQGVNAYVIVDNLHALAGQSVKVSVIVRSADANLKVGSYTGRLHFDPAALQYKAEVTINDGLRVANPNGAGAGEIRFAGANATGFADLTLYSATFTVKAASWSRDLSLQMEELSAARSLANLSPRLQVQRTVLAADQVKP
ncbi:MAG TPA: cohesin domain-containing protein [Gemmatimonadales bacterium]|nr:cohesin domain-containing protein [Gemmatimonadales bacterium]